MPAKLKREARCRACGRDIVAVTRRWGRERVLFEYDHGDDTECEIIGSPEDGKAWADEEDDECRATS